jgi:RNA polymerase sigma factor (sigma-70 family)
MLSAAEEEQFWVFYQKTSQSLFRKAFRMCGGHRTDAEDALQGAYLKALKHWPTMARLADQQRHAWMVTTLSREFKQMWRAPYRNRETGSYEDTGQPPGMPVGRAADDALVARDRYHQACRAIARLKGRQGEIMILHCIAGYEVSEISEMLGISPETVRVHLHDGRKCLQGMIKGEEGTAHD